MEYGTDARAVPIPDDLKVMSEELDALGGGDTRIAPIETYCRVCPLPPAVEASATIAVRIEGSSVVVR